MTRLTSDELARFHDGDEALFRQIVDQYSPRLLAFVLPFARDGDEAQDVLQDAWHRAYHKRRTFTGSGTLLGWLFAICRNVSLGVARTRTSRDAVILDPIDHSGTPPPAPDVATEQAELRRSVYHALMELPDRERDAVILRMLDGRSTRESATVLGCAEGTVKAALHHALKKLQSSMEVWIT